MSLLALLALAGAMTAARKAAAQETVGGIVAPATAPAAASATRPAAMADVAPYINEATIAVIRIDLDRLNLTGVAPWYADRLKAAGTPPQEAGLDLDALRQMTVAWQQRLGALQKAKVRYAYLLTSLALGEQPPVRLVGVLPFERGADPREVIAAAKALGLPALAEGAQVAAEQVGTAVVVGEPAGLAAIKQIEPANRADLEQAMAGGGDAPVSIAVSPPGGLRLAAGLGMPTLPERLGGAATGPIFQGIRWINVSFEAPPNVAMKIVAQTKNADTADKVRGIAIKALNGIKADLPAEAAAQVQPIVDTLVPRARGDQLLITLDTPVIQNLMTSLAKQKGAAADGPKPGLPD